MTAFALISGLVVGMSVGIIFGALWACRGREQIASNSMRLVAEERHRQIHVERFDDLNDDANPPGTLALAASAYALSAGTRHTRFETAPIEPPHTWPWPRIWWKPRDRRSDLVRAGALILAELDRMERMS